MFKQSSKWSNVAEPLLVVLLFLAVWEIASRTGLVSTRDVPPISTILATMVLDLQTPQLWHGVGVTMGAWALGLAVVVVVAVPIGIVLGTSHIAYRSTYLTLEFFRTIPSIAALPILVFLYGTGFQLTLVLVIITAIWPLLIQTTHGVHDVDPVMKDMGRVYGLNRFRQFTQIVLPSAAPYLGTGLRLSGTLALILSIAASLVAGGEGLGELIVSAAESARMPLMYSRVLLAGLIGLIVTSLLLALESRLLHWHPSHRKTST
jgi:ABC-type nitrate/sulfonate/bicarbonate transport system permease component